ncbi:MAG: hypothetical protein ACM3NQ_22740 [Bacteroidales bacterium]
MDSTEAERLLKNLDRRVERIEQYLPTRAGSDELAHLATQEKLDATVARLASKEELNAAVARLATKEELAAAIAPLATKEELAAAIAPLATKEELAAAVAPLATKEELREEGERTRRHFDVVSEQMRHEVRLIAEGHTVLERRAAQADKALKAHDKRLAKLETAALIANRPKKR